MFVLPGWRLAATDKGSTIVMAVFYVGLAGLGAWFVNIHV